jgi:hypothetical protein
MRRAAEVAVVGEMNDHDCGKGQHYVPPSGKGFALAEREAEKEDGSCLQGKRGTVTVATAITP